MTNADLDHLTQSDADLHCSRNSNRHIQYYSDKGIHSVAQDSKKAQQDQY